MYYQTTVKVRGSPNVLPVRVTENEVDIENSYSALHELSLSRWQKWNFIVDLSIVPSKTILHFVTPPTSPLL